MLVEKSLMILHWFVQLLFLSLGIRLMNGSDVFQNINILLFFGWKFGHFLVHGHWLLKLRLKFFSGKNLAIVVINQLIISLDYFLV
jgi:hypothetical protein